MSLSIFAVSRDVGGAPTERSGREGTGANCRPSPFCSCEILAAFSARDATQERCRWDKSSESKQVYVVRASGAVSLPYRSTPSPKTSHTFLQIMCTVSGFAGRARISYFFSSTDPYR